MDSLLQDLRFSVRALRRAPGFAIAALVALALGTGSATAIFSLLHGVVLRPLPYTDGNRLVMIWDTHAGRGLTHEPVSPVNALDYRSLGVVFEDVAVWWRPEVNLSDDVGEPVRVSTVEASENLFDVLGVKPLLGRAFPRDGTLHGSESEVVISHRLWQQRFGADASVLGRTVRLNGFVYTIVGVMPAGFHFPDNTDAWQRLGWDLAQHNRSARFMQAVARLGPGATLERADAALGALMVRLGRAYPALQDWSARVEPLATEVAGPFRPGLFALLGAAGLLLLLACGNLANLLLARATARRSETAVRAAIGATRARLLRQFLTESFVLAAAGSLLGLLLAVLAIRGVLVWSPVEIPRAGEIGIEPAVLAFAAVIVLVTATGFGLAPAVLQSRTGLHPGERGRGKSDAARRIARHMLVAGQVALAVVLLSGAGLLVRSVAHMLAEETGVNAFGVVTVDVQLPDAQYTDWSRVAQFHANVLDALRESPHVTGAGVSNFLPLEAGWQLPFLVEGEPRPAPGEEPTAQAHTVDEAYFEVIGVAVLRGRSFDARDDAERPGVVLVNEAFVQRFLPERDPLGARVALDARQIGPLGFRRSQGTVHEIIGVVADVKNASLARQADPALYFALRQFPFRKMYYVMTGPAAPGTLVAALREPLRRLDPALPIGSVRSMERVLAAEADPSRFVMSVLSVFAALALALAAFGVYGVLSYLVSQRRREIGIRLALGARPFVLLRDVLGEGLLLGTIGAAAGVATAVLGARALRGLLYGVQPADPTTLGAAFAIVLLVTAFACVLPGRRAAQTEPMRTLRE